MEVETVSNIKQSTYGQNDWENSRTMRNKISKLLLKI